MGKVEFFNEKDNVAKTSVTWRIHDHILEKLKEKHQEEGPYNRKTKKRRPFSTYITHILWSYITEKERFKKLMEEAEARGDDLDWS